MARAGLDADPPVQPPPRLRRLLGFAKATGPALATVRKVVDDDAEFRARVRDATNPDDVGRSGWLWLARPPGWKAEFARLLEAAEADAAETAADRDLVQLRRSVERAEVAARKAEARADQAEVAAGEATDALARERDARRRAEAGAASASDARSAAVAERNEAVRSWKHTERALAEARAELRRVRGELRDLRAGPPPVFPAAIPSARAPDGPESATVGVPTPIEEEHRRGPDPVAPQLDRMALAAVLRRAADAVDGLRSALAEAATIAGPPVDRVDSEGRGGTDADPSGSGGDGGAIGGGRGGEGGGRHRRAPRPRRSPSPLPGGRFDDDPAVVDHLVRLPRALLLVDGYNVTKTAWPEVDLAGQRSRLVAALDALHARTGSESVVVFDGAEPEPGTGPRVASGAVRVRFSADGVEADDVILELAGSVPLDRPLIVVSSDNRVRDGARRAGANVIGARQLLDAPVLGRST